MNGSPEIYSNNLLISTSPQLGMGLAKLLKTDSRIFGDFLTLAILKGSTLVPTFKTLKYDSSPILCKRYSKACIAS